MLFARFASLFVLLGLILFAGCARPHTEPAATVTPVASPTLPETPPKFVDITARAGIDFRYQNSKTANRYFVETMGSGCAFIDYDGDGYPDILLLNGAPLPGGHVIGRP